MNGLVLALALAAPSLRLDLDLARPPDAAAWAPAAEGWERESAVPPTEPARWRGREVVAGAAGAFAADAAVVGLAWAAQRASETDRDGMEALLVVSSVAAGVLLPPWGASLGVSLASDEDGHPYRAYFAALAIHLGSAALLQYPLALAAAASGWDAAPVVAVAVAGGLAVHGLLMPAVASWRYHPTPQDRAKPERERDPWDAPASRTVSVPVLAFSF